MVNDNDLLIHVSRPAMASEFEVCFPASLYPNGTELALEALDVVDAVEEQLSFFRPGSQISRINLLAAEGPVEVESWLFDLFVLAMRLYEETAGAYDMTATPLWEVWGFARRSGRVPTDAQLAEARQFVGGQFVELDASRHTIRFLKPGVRITLASIGKGYALDRCCEKMLAAGMTRFLLHGGQSSVLARGDAWEVGLRNPVRPKQRLGVIRLSDRALGTSGIQFQAFRHEGRRYGHLLDPRTGWPVEGVLSTTVLAPTAALADALSTALFVIGPDKSADYCKRHPELGAVIVAEGPNGRVGELTVTGLGPDELTLGSDEEHVS